MNFLQLLLFLFSTYNLSFAEFVNEVEGEEGITHHRSSEPKTIKRWKAQSKNFKAAEAKIAAMRAAAAAKAAESEAIAYSNLMRAAESPQDKIKARKMIEKNKLRAAEFAAESRRQAIIAGATNLNQKRSYLSKTKWSSEDFMEAARKAEAAAAFLRSIAEAKRKEEVGNEGFQPKATRRTVFNRAMSDDALNWGMRSDHDYSYDNTDDYVNDMPANDKELFYTVYDYDSGSRNQLVRAIEPKDLINNSESLKH